MTDTDYAISVDIAHEGVSITTCTTFSTANGAARSLVQLKQAMSTNSVVVIHAASDVRGSASTMCRGTDIMLVACRPPLTVAEIELAEKWLAL